MSKQPTFSEIMQWDAQQARDYLERIRWPDGPVCPNGCASEVYRIEAKTRRKDKDGNVRVQPTRYLLKCKQCRQQFTPTVGTIFEDSKVPLNKWLAAIYLMCTSKKGISAHQLHRMIGVQYRTAWYMCHRVRAAMQDKSGPLSGIIEADETYVGGKPRRHPRKRKGGGYADKGVVFGILERGGRVRPVAMPRIDGRRAFEEIRRHIDLPNSRLITDESKLYMMLNTMLPHEIVTHSESYVTGDNIHTQGIENFWSRLKRQLYGTHHHVEGRYLGMYADEVAFKHNTRASNDAERFEACVQASPGQRLSWFASEGERRPAS